MQGRAIRCGVFGVRDATAIGVTGRLTSMTQGDLSKSRVMTHVTGVTQLPVGHVFGDPKTPRKTCEILPPSANTALDAGRICWLMV
jgi:hypothetical protein